jgi:TetR/AcrR family transcriptional regulator, lmrAB and yxaGH operons repressor
MPTDARDRMVRSAVLLLARHGYQATSFGAVLEHSGAPRGSIYHHFPDGKDELIAAAIDLAGGEAIALLDGLAGRSPAEVVEGFLAMWRAVLDRGGFEVGCSVLAVAVSADDRELVERAGGVFRAWTARLAELFVAGGRDAASARALATLVIAASEGAVALARAERDAAPFEEVAAQLVAAAAG